MRKIIQIFQKNFKIKIFFVSFLFVALLVTFLDIFLYYRFSSVLITETQNSMKNTLENASYNFDNILISTRNNISALSLDSDLIHHISKKDDVYSFDFFSTNWLIKEKLNNSKLNQDALKSNYLISSDYNYFYRTNMNRTYTKDELLTAPWIMKIEEKQFNRWIPIPEDSLTDSSPSSTLSYITPVKNSSMSENVGYLLANIDSKTVRKFFQNLTLGENGYYIVYTSELDIVYHPDISMVTGNSKMPTNSLLTSSTQFTDTEMISSLYSAETDLIYTAHIPLNEVIAPAASFQKLVLLLLSGCLFLAFLFSGMISHAIFSPIQLLIQHMQRLGSGEKNPVITRKRTDEFGILFQNFNEMSTQIDILIREVYSQQLLTKELQLKNLHSQLSPHFLYNTLDMIHWAAREKDDDAVCNMVFLLSSYFRKSLSYGKEFVPIEEINHMLQIYMDLQAYRYPDKFTYTLKTDPQLSSISVPKHLFQPIVENALQHGIEKSPNQGICSITWKACKDFFTFTVEDNGVGIREADLFQIRSSLTEDVLPTEENFALKSINLQLKLYYHTELQIFSTWGQGTRVIIHIPYSNLSTKEDNIHV